MSNEHLQILAYALSHAHYYVAVFVMMTGFYMVLASRHLVKKLIGLGSFQVSALLLYIASGWRADAAPPIFIGNATAHVSPLPQVLMLTAIVVGLATLSVGLALVVRIYHAYGSLDEQEILRQDNDDHQYDQHGGGQHGGGQHGGAADVAASASDGGKKP